MANGLENMIAKTRMLAGLAKARELNDRQLLEEFADGDETAFTALVDRYGGLVMGVCQRVLQHRQDAEDAFQATFMVLARKAHSVAWKDTVANWLHGVACRIAFQIRREKARRQARQGTVSEPVAPVHDPAWSELKPVLDEELDRLPAKYRKVLILCCLEGKSRDEAAVVLGWSPGSVKGRLERGRELLRSRLARRGIALSAALAATLLATAGAQAAVPLTLGFETVRGGMAMLTGQTAGVVSTQVLTLTKGALHAMFLTKLKFAAAVVLTVITLGLGGGYVAHQAVAGYNADRLALRQDQKDDGEQNKKNDGQKNQKDDGLKESAASYVPELSEFLGQREGREEPKQAPIVNGIVKTADAKTITVLVNRGEPDGQTFDVSKDVKVVVREGRETKDAKIADVQPRSRVQLTLDDAKKVVQTIAIIGDGPRGIDDGRTFRGYVTEIDAGKTITFQMGVRGEAAPTTKSFDLAKNVKVNIRTGRNIREGKLDDVPLKTVIMVRLDEAKKVVELIEVSISTTVSGAVSEIDAKSITLVWGRDEVKSATYDLSKDVKVQYRVPGTGDRTNPGEVKTVKLAEVVAKTNVTLQLDDALKVVQSIEVQLLHARATIGDIDAKKGTMTLKVGRGDDLNVSVAKDARIQIDGKAGTLDKVAAGAEVVVVLSPNRTQVLALQTPVPERRE